MKIRTDTILRLRDHLLATSSPGASDPAAASTADAILRRIDPFAELMYAVIAADTVVRPEETQALISALDILGGGAVPMERLAELVSRFESEAPAVDSEGRVAAAAARIGGEREDREMAFMLAAAVALADDHFETRERQVMQWVRGYLGITERRMDTLLTTPG